MVQIQYEGNRNKYSYVKPNNSILDIAHRYNDSIYIYKNKDRNIHITNVRTSNSNSDFNYCYFVL